MSDIIGWAIVWGMVALAAYLIGYNVAMAIHYWSGA